MAVRGRWPGLDKNPAYWRLLLYLVSGGQPDDETGEPVIPAALLAEFEGRVAQHTARYYVAKDFLEAFRRDVLPDFSYGDADHSESRARTVTNRGLPPEVFVWFDRMQVELAGGAGDVVDAVTGRKRSRSVVAAERRADFEEVEAFVRAYHVSPEARAVIGYHNELPANRFAAVVRDFQAEALDVAGSLPSVEARRQAFAVLAQIRLFPKPLLRPVENSARPFSLRPSLLTVKSGVRRVFTQRWVDYDLATAQLAIVAREWAVPGLLSFLAVGESVWAYLFEALDVGSELKPALKTAVYSLVFGASKGAIRRDLMSDSGRIGVDEAFFEAPLVKEVYDARERRIRDLLDARGGSTSLGRDIRIPYGTWQERAAYARSILAQQAQAIELQLIHPVYELAATTDQFTVMLYQFDGITVSFRDERSAAYWHGRIVGAVADAAESLGVLTRFEHEPGAAVAGSLIFSS